jgi:hypothetical protein
LLEVLAVPQGILDLERGERSLALNPEKVSLNQIGFIFHRLLLW